jgi:hypothetical protein
MPVLLILCHNSSLVTWTIISFTTCKFKPLIFLTSLHYTSLHFTTLHYTTLHYTTLKVKVTLRLTVSLSVSLGVEPHLGLMTRYLAITIWQLRSCFCGAPSLARGRVCLLYMLLGLPSAVFLGSWVPWYSRPYFTVSDLRLPILSPLNDSQGHGGGIRPRLHTSPPTLHYTTLHYTTLTPLHYTTLTPLLITSWHGPHREHCSCIQLFPWKHACLRNHYLVTAVVYLLTQSRCPAAGLHATIYIHCWMLTFTSKLNMINHNKQSF